MAQWANHLQNNIFVNPPPLPLLCGISGALHLVQLGLMAGMQAGRQNTGEFRNFQFDYRLKSLTCHFVQHHYSLTNAFQPVFWVKSIARIILKHEIFQKPYNFPPIPSIKYYRT